MGEASASELNPEPIKDLRAMRGQSVMCMYELLLKITCTPNAQRARRGHGILSLPYSNLFPLIICSGAIRAL